MKSFPLIVLITLVVRLPVSTPAQTAAQQLSPSLPITQDRDSLTLEAATEQFLRRNLALEAARLQVGVAATKRISARLFPRPGVTVSAENLRLSGPTQFNGLYEVGVTVAQPFELGNRRERRADLAERTVAVAEAQLNSILRRRIFELRRTYYETILARTVLNIERENRDNFAELVRFNTVRFEEGYIPEGELIRVRLERVKYDSTIAQATLALRQSNVRLLELLGETEFGRAATLDVLGTLQRREATLELENMHLTALANRPDIKVAEAVLSLAEAFSELERSRAKGEITPFVGYRRVGRDNTGLAGVTLPLPFGNRNQAGVARALAERQVAETNLQLTRNRARAEVDSAFRSYETAREQVKAYESGLLGQADESRDIQLASYREGVVELITLLDAQRTRSEVRINYYRALFDYQMSIFELELATGVDIKQ